MKRKSVATFVFGVCVIAWGCGVSTQQAEVQFRLLEEVYITPGTAEEFEASSMARTARMAAGNVAFGRLASVSDDGVYRFLNQLGGDFSSVGEWREQITAMPASPTPNPAAGIIDHIDFSVWQSRPDLSLTPDSPRIENSEIGFIHEIRLYPKFGAAEEVAELLQKIRDLSESRNINSRRLVAQLVAGTGPEWPVFSLVFLARDAEDYYAQSARDIEARGDEGQELVNQVQRLCRKLEREHYTARQDLGYQPSN